MPDITGRVEYGRFIPQTDMLVGRLRFRPEEMGSLSCHPPNQVIPSLLCDIRLDEAQEHDLAGTPLEREYIDALCRALREVQAPAEQSGRLGLPV